MKTPSKLILLEDTLTKLSSHFCGENCCKKNLLVINYIEPVENIEDFSGCWSSSVWKTSDFVVFR